MEEIIELWSLIQRGDTQSTLMPINELEEMSKLEHIYLNPKKFVRFA